LQFHKVIRTAFGKEYPQKLLFAFSPSGKGSTPQISIDIPFSKHPGAKATSLSSIFKRQGQVFTYQPDNLDDWQHQIILEEIIKDEISDADCIAGEGAYPPEACAGFDDYEEIKHILSDKNHLKYQFTHEWLELGEHATWEEAHKFNLFEIKEQMKQIDAELKTFRNYTIVPYDTFDEIYGLNPMLWLSIDKAKAQIVEKKNLAGTVQELERLVRKYPNIPHLKNSLSMVYLEIDKKKARDKTKRFFEIALSNFANYPDYVMGRNSLALEYVHDHPEKTYELLGKDFDLSVLYPKRNGNFTETEIFSYHIAVFQYCLETNNETEAVKHLNFLDFHFTDKIRGSAFEFQLILFRMKTAAESKTYRQSIEVIPEKVEATDKAPDFEHPEMEILYKEEAFIERATLDKIMALPRESVIRDLQKILLDNIARFQYFNENSELYLPYASTHALYILSALEAEEALDTLFIVLRQNSDYYDFWYGDMLGNEFWRFIISMGQNRLDRLKDFILEPNRYSYARVAVSAAVMQIALHQPERKEEIFKWYEDVLQYLMDRKNDTAIFNKTVYSFLLDDLIKISVKEQFHFVKRFCDESLVDQFIVPLNEIKQSLAREKTPKKGDEIYTSIHQYYDYWQGWVNRKEKAQSKSVLSSINEPVSTPAAPSNKPTASKIVAEEAAPSESFIPSNKIPHVAAPKVGRNEPCPCGSGKKYKKCCGE